MYYTWEKWEMYTEFSSKNVKGKYLLKDTGIDEWIIFKVYLKEIE
jgi:hypothetical protein